MRLYEYQAKELFRQAGILPENYRFAVVSQAAAGPAAVRRLGKAPWIAKAQVLAGGRGKAGGIQRIAKPSETVRVLKDLVGKTLVSAQTGAAGEKIRRVLIEPAQQV